MSNKPKLGPGQRFRGSQSNGARTGLAPARSSAPGSSLANALNFGPAERWQEPPASGAAALAPNVQPNLGRQLSRRVAAGEISQEQALRTLRQRAQLRRAYGRDWRKRVFGGVDVQRVRAAIANGNRDQLDLYDQLMLDRAEWLARAAGALDDARPAF